MTHSANKPFDKVLIANRGEIAVRILRTARQKGYRTVAVYSLADAGAPHVKLADEAVFLGDGPVGDTYLNPEKILQAMKTSQADALHPGYGFLSENADFAEACLREGFRFIGPPPEAIRLMGSKRLSKIAMMAADVPCIPGYEGEDQSDATLIAEAKRIGLPVMLKASAGGGGRGMRLVHSADELEAMIKTARSEATNAFGSGELIIEKALINPRHIEIQIFADNNGHTIYLGERDCSIQRRHQKVVEEAPSPFIDEPLRQRMGEAAVQAARACQYVGAGTVEFLVDENRQFYFLEMNTRLQVEHPVTELVTGTDLVGWQLDIASGLPLPKTQKDVTLNGHAIEVRLYAEDPAHQFMPQTGRITHWLPAEGDGLRIDTGITQGSVVTPLYDPMLAKVIAHGANRLEAIRKLQNALMDTTLFGVSVNTEFLIGILSHPVFRAGDATTGFIPDHFTDDPSMQPRTPDLETAALAAIALYLHGFSESTLTTHQNWRSANRAPWPYELKLGGTVMELTLSAEADGRFSAQNGTTSIEYTVLETVPIGHDGLHELTYVEGTHRKRCRYAVSGDAVYLQVDGRTLHWLDRTHEVAASSAEGGTGCIVACMDGLIVDVCAEPGMRVQPGQTLVVLEAMKMEHPLKADVEGTIQEVQVVTGDQVKIRQPLVIIAPDNEE